MTPQKDERTLYDICFELSEHTELGLVSPVMVEFMDLTIYKGLNKYQAIGELYKKYTPNEVKNE